MYRVIITPEYYAGTANAAQEAYITASDVNHDDSGYTEPYEWETEAEAQAWIDSQQSDDIYYLSHGEAGLPVYSIESDDDASEDCLDGACGDTYKDGTRVEREDIPTDILHRLDSLNVEYASSGDDYDIYDAETDGYIIVYCPTTLALQRNVDDLGGLQWGNEAYYKILKESKGVR